MLYPEEWNRTPIIRIKNQELRTALGLKEEYASLDHLFDGTQYKLQPLWQREQGNRSKLAQAIQETDEKSRTHPHAPARHARPSAAARRSTSQ